VNNPEYHKGLLEEAEKIYNENKHLSHYSIEVIDKMKKLDNFIRESLRYNTYASKKF
jgi:hypothetical protein